MKYSCLEQARIDCILIWGHGLIHINDILNDIESNKNLQVLRIQKHRPKSIKKFVKKIYSYDYAPFWHLKLKTKYLLKTSHEVCFVFVKNINPAEDYFGEGSFRHKESSSLKEFKERIRDKYNPYENGKRSHEHVIHATDSQDQTGQILNYLGYEQGVRYFDHQNEFINMPYYLKDYKEFEFKSVDVIKLYCNTIEGEGWDSYNVKTIHITESPQYRALFEDMTIYSNYISKYLGGPLKDNHNLERYKKIYEQFEYLKEPYMNSFVIVNKTESRYIILDGLHRACIHLFQGNTKIIICQVSK